MSSYTEKILCLWQSTNMKIIIKLDALVSMRDMGVRSRSPATWPESCWEKKIYNDQLFSQYASKNTAIFFKCQLLSSPLKVNHDVIWRFMTSQYATLRKMGTSRKWVSDPYLLYFPRYRKFAKFQLFFFLQILHKIFFSPSPISWQSFKFLALILFEIWHLQNFSQIF